MTPRALAIRIGVVGALAAALAAVVAGQITPTSPAGARVRCIPFPAGWVDDGGMVTVRFDSLLLQRTALDTLTFPAGPSTAWGDGEVQGYPALLPDGTTPDTSKLVPLPPGFLRPDDESTVSLRASPALPQCQVAVRVAGAGGAGFACACCASSGAACLTGPGGTVQGVPNHTYWPGEFTPGGAGVVPKPCIEMQGQPTSMPAACL